MSDEREKDLIALKGGDWSNQCHLDGAMAFLLALLPLVYW